MNAWKRLIAMLLAMSMVLALAACGSSSSSTESTSTSEEITAESTTEEAAAEDEVLIEDASAVTLGGTLTSYYTEFYGEYDPSAYTNRCYISFYYDMLWSINWSSDSGYSYTSTYLDATQLTAGLAASWEIAEDYTSITVTLRDDVYFQDKVAAGFAEEYDIYGARQLVASDVKWSYDRLLGLDGTELVELDQTSWTSQLSMLESVEVIDDLTVVFHFNTDTALSVENFMCVRVNIAGPEWDELTDDQKTDWHYACGTGPFILTEYITDNSMTFIKNPNYWGTDENGVQLPYLDTVELIHVTDSATRLASFLSGELDCIPVSGSGIIGADEISQVANTMSADDFYTVTVYGSPMSIGLKQGVSEALDNLTVRTAMQYAIDLEAISTFMGYEYDADAEVTSMISGVFRSTTAWSSVTSWSDELIESYTTYDPDKAKELLAEAGYADGFEFDVTIFSYLSTELFQLVGEYLSKVGITMNLTVGITPQDMTAVGADATDVNSVFYTTALTALTNLQNSVSSTGALNYVHQQDDEVDALIESVVSAGDTETQIAAANELDETYMSQHYILLITYSEPSSSLYRSNVHGINNCNLYVNYLWGYIYARTWVD